MTDPGGALEELERRGAEQSDAVENGPTGELTDAVGGQPAPARSIAERIESEWERARRRVESGRSTEARDSGRPELSVVVPTYNEEDGVQKALEQLERVVDALVDSYEIVVVDDGSDDGTSGVLRAMADARERIQHVRHDTNHGKGAALRTGCETVSGEHVLFIDADGDLDPTEVAVFMEKMEEEDADVVIGSKRHPESKVEYPPRRTVLSKGYSLLVRGLFGLRVTDTQVGMKLLKREVVEEVMPLLLVKRYAFDVELLALAVDRGYSVAEAPVALEFNEGSHIDWKAVWNMAWDTAAVFYRLRLVRYYDAVEDEIDSKDD